jgi:hypothetical protein
MRQHQKVERNPKLTWMEDFDYFKDQCLLGKEFERFVAAKLAKHGISVTVEDDGIRESVGQISRYTKTSGDLKIKGWPFEVKSRNVEFTSPDDFPFWPMFVDTVKSYDQKLIKPKGYIFVSQPTGALIGLTSKHQPSWSKVNKFDTERKIKDAFYCVDRKYTVGEDTLIQRLKDMSTCDLY